jgi:hypothetical protein
MALQFVDGYVPAHGNIADKPNIVGQSDLFITAGNRLDGLMVRRNAETYKAKGDWQPVNDIDADIVAEFLLCCFGCVIARRTRPNDCDMSHVRLSVVPDSAR